MTLTLRLAAHVALGVAAIAAVAVGAPSSAASPEAPSRPSVSRVSPLGDSHGKHVFRLSLRAEALREARLWQEPYGGCDESWQAPHSVGAQECRDHGYIGWQLWPRPIFGHAPCWVKVGPTSYVRCADGFRETS